eukprot:Tbor_TRINITY_DN6106_c0_g3::TRINITY_DN6106_c0_g3_i1::g.21466::m.21466/K19476/IST1; vacuolar protein sorting-associated protein IST1
MGLFNFRRTEAVFDQSKLKANLRMAISRIKIHQNKIVNSVKIQRRGLAELIAAGKNDSVRVKVEALIREDASLGGLEMLILFCDFISSRSQVIAACDKEMTSPPPDLKEAISSIIWASGRVDNIPELVAVRKQFELRYSKAFVESSMRNEEFSSNENIIERLGVSVPDNESCIKYIHGIASEFNVIFDASNLTPATFVAVADDREIIDTCELGDIKEIDGNDFEGFTTACGFRVPPIRKPRDELEVRLLTLM